jgi:hypothetical protein
MKESLFRMGEKEVNEMIDNLVLMGYLDVVGIDSDSGEFLYGVSPEIKKLIPQIAEELNEMFLKQVENLWTKGFVSMDVTEQNPMVSLTELAFDQNKVDALSFEERNTLALIKEALKNKE